MQFLTRLPKNPTRLGILPGSFNPPTNAHLFLALAALSDPQAALDEVVLVLPCAFPHKNFDGATFAQRAQMLRALLNGHPRLSAATSAGGLFIEIAEECRTACGAQVRLDFVCGRDAAERIVRWDYGNPNAINQMLESFGLLVAYRDGTYQPPPDLARHIRFLPLSADLNAVSASEVRRRISHGLAWEHLVPEVIQPLVRQIYRPLL
jgi:nicotinate (nicotinamide) nucleotide adenylyltransferase